MWPLICWLVMGMHAVAADLAPMSNHDIVELMEQTEEFRLFEKQKRCPVVELGRILERLVPVDIWRLCPPTGLGGMQFEADPVRGELFDNGQNRLNTPAINKTRARIRQRHLNQRLSDDELRCLGAVALAVPKHCVEVDGVLQQDRTVHLLRRSFRCDEVPSLGVRSINRQTFAVYNVETNQLMADAEVVQMQRALQRQRSEEMFGATEMAELLHIVAEEENWKAANNGRRWVLESYFGRSYRHVIRYVAPSGEDKLALFDVRDGAISSYSNGMAIGNGVKSRAKRDLLLQRAIQSKLQARDYVARVCERR